MGFRAVVLTFVTWIWLFVSQRYGEDRSVDMYGVDMYGEGGVSGSCADLCDMDLGFCVTGVWCGWGFGQLC